MSDRKFHLHNGRRGAALAIRVTPRAQRNEVVGVLEDGTIKIRLVAPPVGGKANESLVEYLAGILQVSKGSIEILAGITGRDKLVSIEGIDAGLAQARILDQISN